MKRFVALTLTLCALAAPAFAGSLDSAKAKGLVGERLDGYIGAVQNTPEANAVVAEINAARKAEYAKIAAKNAQPVSVVEKLAAGKLIGKVSAGEYYQDASGAWRQK